MTLKEFVRREVMYYFNILESKILTNWIWGPRQNIEATKTVIQPIEKVQSLQSLHIIAKFHL